MKTAARCSMATTRAFSPSPGAQGADYMLETEAYDFIYDEATSTVKGVKARSVVTGQEYTINAKAVIMGCGGFGNNPELMDSLLDPRWSGIHKNLGFGTDTGLMMQAALNIGAGTWNADMSPIIMHLGLPRYLNKYEINQDESKLVGRTAATPPGRSTTCPWGLGLRGDSIAIDTAGKLLRQEATLMSSHLTSKASPSTPTSQARTSTRCSRSPRPMKFPPTASPPSLVGRATCLAVASPTSCPFPR